MPNAAKQQLLRLLLLQQRVRRWDGRFGDASHAGVKASGKGTLCLMERMWYLMLASPALTQL